MTMVSGERHQAQSSCKRFWLTALLHEYLMRDGFSGYHKVTGVRHCGCMVHVRLGFVEAMPKDRKSQQSSVAADAGRYFDRIYHEESLLKELSAEERHKERLAKIKPLLNELFAWLETVPVSGKGNLTDAVHYALHEKPNLYTFLENGDVPLDNNRAENAIRPFAVGRKNWMHCNTANGASWTAILYSILATAQANEIDAERYLTDLFSQPVGTIIQPFDSYTAIPAIFRRRWFFHHGREYLTVTIIIKMFSLLPVYRICPHRQPAGA